MKKDIRNFTALLLIFLIPCLGSAQSPKNNTLEFSKKMFYFFIGEWNGKGQFSNGKEIIAHISFHVSLDSCWLISEHTDNPPNRYKALAVWGIDKLTGKALNYVFDNFHGHRKFESEGILENKIIWTYSEQSDSKTFYQRFTYEILSPTSFKMTYETSLNNIDWKMGDYLAFEKEN